MSARRRAGEGPGFPRPLRLEDHETGGGCMALRAFLPGGVEMLITSAYGHEIPDGNPETGWIIGFYAPDGSFVTVERAPGAAVVLSVESDL